MAALRLLLWATIGPMLLLWGPPLLIAPDELLRWLWFPVTEISVFRRLLGAACVALAVGYTGGLTDIAAGRFPATSIRMGIVSNALAAAVIVGLYIRGAFDTRGVPVLSFMLLPAGATAAITIGLVVPGLGARRGR